MVLHNARGVRITDRRGIVIEIKDFVSEEVLGGKTFVTVTVKDEADEAAFRTIAFSKPMFVPPVTLSEENDELIFSFDVTAERFLKLSMLPNAMSPTEFLAFMKNLTQALVNCDDYFMNPLNFLVLEDYIYINPKDYDVRLIYAPFCESIFSESNISSNIFRISRRFAKTVGDGWQDIITRLWNMSESTSVYEASELFNALYDEHKGNEHVVEETPAARTTYTPTPSLRTKPNDAPREPDRIPTASQEPPVNFPIMREPETEKKKKGLFGFGEKSDKKDAKKEQLKKEPKKQEKGGLFSNQAKEDKPATPAKAVENKPVKESRGFFGGGNKSVLSKPQQLNTSNWSQSSANVDVTVLPPGEYDQHSDVTQPPPGAYVQYDDDTTQPPPGYQNISSARFDFCGGKNMQNMPETIRVELKDGVFMIGRVKNGKNTCDFAFPESTGGVSHLHARVSEKDGRYFITDMNTRYGTYVGFYKIAPMKEIELNDGEMVSFSMGVDYEFHIERGR